MEERVVDERAMEERGMDEWAMEEPGVAVENSDDEVKAPEEEQAGQKGEVDAEDTMEIKARGVTPTKKRKRIEENPKEGHEYVASSSSRMLEHHQEFTDHRPKDTLRDDKHLPVGEEQLLMSPMPDPHDPGSSSSSSTPAAVPMGYEYEVFLSFSGSDTRKDFTDHLYQTLKNAGIRVFRDNEELPKGEEIGPELLKAIEQSKISVPIFSEHYASSKWCLQEAAQMVECMKTTKQLILPVFYDVTPHEVRHQTGAHYGPAFSDHEKKHRLEVVEEWKSALSEIGKLKGWDLTVPGSSYQGELVQVILSDVRKHLNEFHIPVSGNLVGIEDHVDEIMDLLDVEIEDVRIVGIWGMVGVGKTTIAKFVYDQLTARFDFYSFIGDIRERSQHQPNGMVSLQQQLLSDILRNHRQDEIARVDKGKDILQNRLCNKRVLILLDDVDHRDQLHHLLPFHHCLAKGSRIMITTDDRRALDIFEVYRTYQVTGLNQEDALVLFCKYAFRQNFPTPEFAELSREITKATGGLPLAIEVIGCHLFSESQESIWQEALDRLRKEPEIQQRLEISIKTLNRSDHDVFLDTACLFAGMDSRVLAHMWKACDCEPESAIRDLELRSLIKIGDDNALWMHNLLKNLGREIVHNENANAPGERSRIWRHEDAVRVLRTGSGTSKVIAIRLECGLTEGLVARKCENLNNLRFLDLGDADLPGNLDENLWTLKWLSWHGHTLSIPSQLDDLVVLDMSKSGVTSDWIGWSSVKILRELKVVNLTSCHHIRGTPQFNSFQPIRRLILDDCQELHEIDPSIGNLKALESLSLKNCCSLERLPQEVGSLSSLTELVIDGTLITEIPTSAAGMPSLRVLSAKWCTSLSRLPNSIRSLKKLQRLLLDRCLSLIEIPSSIGELQSLVELDVSHTSVSCLPDSVGNLTNLQVLDMSHTLVRELPHSLRKLQKLQVFDASYCRSLGGIVPLDLEVTTTLRILRLEETEITKIPSCNHQHTHLQTLDLKSCKSLGTLPDLPVSLIHLKITCPSSTLAQLERLPKLVHLKQLEILGCEMLTGLPPEISNLPRLRELSIGDCPHIASLPRLPSDLRCLRLSGLSSLDGLPDLSNLRKLSRFSLVDCDMVREVPGLRDLVSLKSLRISSSLLTDLDGLESLPSLSYLSVENCDFLEWLPDLSRLKRILDITVQQCAELIEIRGLSSLELLATLSISGCTSLGALPGLSLESPEILDLSTLQKLKSLRLEGLRFIEEIHGINQLESLEILSISGCKALEMFQFLSPLQELKQLKLEDCNKLQQISLTHSTSLERLDISNCMELKELSLPDPSYKLKHLKLSYCYGLRRVPEMTRLTSLEILHIYHCGRRTRQLTLQNDIPRQLISLTHSTSLEMLDISDCMGLRDLSLPDPSYRLKQLKLENCKELGQVRNMTELTLLEILCIYGCGRINLLPDLPSLLNLKQLKLENCNIQRISLTHSTSLEILDIFKCTKLKELLLPDPSSKLKQLKLSDCYELGQVPEMTRLTSLEILSISRCGPREMLPDLSSLLNLKELTLENGIQLQHISLIHSTSLEMLHIDKGRELEMLLLPGPLSKLKQLKLEHCDRLRRISLKHSTSLEMLHIYYCRELEMLLLPDPSSKLWQLKLEHCDRLAKISENANLTSLEMLHVSSCMALEMLPALPSVQLKELKLRDCGKLGQIPPLKGSTSLEMVEIFNCGVTNIPDISSLPKLKQLKLSYCSNLRELGALKELASLEVLEMDSCDALLQLPDLSSLNNLKKLNISGCHALKELPDVSNLQKLRTLTARDCTRLVRIPGLGELVSLGELYLHGCDGIKELPDLSNMKRLYAKSLPPYLQ